ncbi:MAG: F0F1 ATP synthase subunit epsilon [Candidatus Liptonbacteria bacterium]|nr:F0F1 ATP synthase subunit epsilon [Candidatus Liptonbacteria bacterium]
MKLAIYSLKKILFQGKAESVNCKTALGEITVLDHHRPLVTKLAPGVIKIIDKEKKDHYIPVSSGFLEMNSGNQAKLIVDEPV